MSTYRVSHRIIRNSNRNRIYLSHCCSILIVVTCCSILIVVTCGILIVVTCGGYLWWLLCCLRWLLLVVYFRAYLCIIFNVWKWGRWAIPAIIAHPHLYSKNPTFMLETSIKSMIGYFFAGIAHRPYFHKCNYRLLHLHVCCILHVCFIYTFALAFCVLYIEK